MISEREFSRALDAARVGEGPRALARFIRSVPDVTFDSALQALRVTPRSLLRYENALLEAGMLSIVIEWADGARARRYALLPRRSDPS